VLGEQIGGKAMKIEPMTIDEIKAEVAKIDWRFALLEEAHSCRQARRWMTWAHSEALRWMTWAHSEARAREAEFWLGVYENSPRLNAEQDEPLKQTNWEDADWLSEVLRKIGWPENQSE
jgi:hypothetical protein